MKKPEIGTMCRIAADGTSTTLDGSTLEKIEMFGLHCAQAVSWDMSLAIPEVARSLKERAVAHGIRLTAIWGGYSGPTAWNFTRGPVTLGLVPPEYRESRIRDLKRWAEFAVEAGAPAIITHCGFLPENMTDPVFEPVAVAIEDVAKYCKKLGIGFWFETGQETPVVLLRYIQEIGLDNLGINLDPANLVMYGKGNPIDALSVFGKYVRAIHAKDGIPPTDGKNLGREVKVGTGYVRYQEFIPALLKCGFEGDLTIEREISGKEQDEDIRDTVTYLKQLID